MKYTFRVKPGADPDQIKLAWRGAGGVELKAAGELAVTTPAGGFTDERPVSWQQADGRQVEVATKYRLASARAAQAAVAYGFEVGGGMPRSWPIGRLVYPPTTNVEKKPIHLYDDKPIAVLYA